MSFTAQRDVEEGKIKNNYINSSLALIQDSSYFYVRLASLKIL